MMCALICTYHALVYTYDVCLSIYIYDALVYTYDACLYIACYVYTFLCDGNHRCDWQQHDIHKHTSTHKLPYRSSHTIHTHVFAQLLDHSSTHACTQHPFCRCAILCAALRCWASLGVCLAPYLLRRCAQTDGCQKHQTAKHVGSWCSRWV